MLTAFRPNLHRDFLNSRYAVFFSVSKPLSASDQILSSKRHAGLRVSAVAVSRHSIAPSEPWPGLPEPFALPLPLVRVERLKTEVESPNFCWLSLLSKALTQRDPGVGTRTTASVGSQCLVAGAKGIRTAGPLCAPYIRARLVSERFQRGHSQKTAQRSFLRRPSGRAVTRRSLRLNKSISMRQQTRHLVG